MCDGVDPSVSIKNSSLIGHLREEKAILTHPSPAFREEIPPEFQTRTGVLGTRAAAALLGKDVTNSQSVAVGKLRHSILMQFIWGCSACVPGQQDSQQGRDWPWDSRTHSIPVPALWSDEVLPSDPRLCSMPCCSSNQTSAVLGLQAHRNGVSAFPNALLMEDKTLGGLKEER